MVPNGMVSSKHIIEASPEFIDSGVIVIANFYPSVITTALDSFFFGCRVQSKSPVGEILFGVEVCNMIENSTKSILSAFYLRVLATPIYSVQKDRLMPLPSGICLQRLISESSPNTVNLQEAHNKLSRLMHQQPLMFGFPG